MMYFLILLKVMFMLISVYDIILFSIITFILIFSTSEKFEIIFKKNG